MTVWDQLIGQQRAVDTLRVAAEEGRAIAQHQPVPRQALSHAWLITGPPGSGRSVAARCLAASLQCTGQPIGCGQCNGCRTVMAGSNSDVQVYATDRVVITVDESKEWLSHAYDAPVNGRWRVTIIEDADRMHERAANRLLKSIEEPPERGIWILCAPTPAEVLPTIRSRCRALALRTPDVQAVANYLVRSEAVTLEQATEAASIAQSHVGFARGMLRNPNLRPNFRNVFSMPLTPRSVGQAVLVAGRMYDALVAMSKEQGERLDARERKELLESLGVEEGSRVPPALRARVRDLEEDQKRRGKRALADAIDRTLTDLLSFYRDVLAVQLGADIALVNVDMRKQVQEAAKSSDPRMSMARVEIVEAARKRNRTTAAPLLLLEAMAISLVDPHLVENPA